MTQHCPTKGGALFYVTAYLVMMLSNDDVMFEVESLKLVRRYLLKGMNDSIGRKSVKV